jgi:hypothetical protein
VWVQLLALVQVLLQSVVWSVAAWVPVQSQAQAMVA